MRRRNALNLRRTKAVRSPLQNNVSPSQLTTAKFIRPRSTPATFVPTHGVTWTETESQVPAPTLLMQLSCALLDGCTESSEQLCLPVSRLQGYTDTANVSRKA